ncbi:uncharacterized protein LOC128984426 [Macrosteles quadrilineatus]|uniref:uncharacterized protein LOC128984426 n=1 Tax=Macrosteles quadrilineatus TaxID=74068 RepID=UPI0023E1EC1E|nr:uncharacterized protein LOC128984426 [Macrosteles quadrilineatus]
MTEQQLKTLCQKRGQTKAKLTRFKKYVDAIVDNDLSQLKSRLALFQPLVQEFEQIQGDIELLDSESDHEAERESFENTYFELIAQAEALLTDNQPISTPSSSVVSNNSSISVKLPTIKLPTFGGKYEEWTSFQEIFHSLVHDNTSLTDTQKFHYLKTSLHGPAISVIESLEVTSVNYTTAWSLLKERFENKRILINNHIASLYNINKIERESGLELRSLIDSVNKHLRALENLGHPVQSWDTLLIFTLTKKLDHPTLRLWESHIVSSDVPTFSNFITFLKSRCQTLEAIDLNHSDQSTSPYSHSNKMLHHNRHNTISNSHSKQSSGSPHSYSNQMLPHVRQHTTLVTSSSSVTCPYCNGNHKIFQCNQFKSLKPTDRYSSIKELGMCINCFSKSHKIKDCQAGACKVCNNKHNTMLHFDSDTENHHIIDQSTEEQPNNHSTSFMTTTLASHCDNLQVVLPTALVDVEDNEGNKHQCRVLLDSASQSNFITENMADKLRLHKHKTSTIVSGISEQQANTSSSVVCKLHSQHTAYKTSIDCLVIPKITHHLPRIEMNTDNWQIPPSLNLADFRFNTPGPIDMLIGAELFFHLLNIGQMRLHQNGPLLQKTSLGWVASGKVKTNHSPTLRSHCHLTVSNYGDMSTPHSVNATNLGRSVDQQWRSQASNFHSNQRAIIRDDNRHFTSGKLRGPLTSISKPTARSWWPQSRQQQCHQNSCQPPPHHHH